MIEEQTNPPPVDAICSWYDLPCVATSALDWLSNAFLAIPRLIYAQFTDSVAAGVEAIPIPEFLEQIGARSNAVEAIQGIGYIADAFALSDGMAIILSAIAFRYGVRWMPLGPK